MRLHLVIIHHQASDLDGQPGFADTAGAGQGEQAACRIVEKSHHPVEFFYPADKGNGIRWKIMCDHGSTSCPLNVHMLHSIINLTVNAWEAPYPKGSV